MEREREELDERVKDQITGATSFSGSTVTSTSRFSRVSLVFARSLMPSGATAQVTEQLLVAEVESEMR